MISFEESVKDIVGLTSYEEGKLPAWLRDHLQHHAGADQIEDAELVERFVHGDWLGHWGVAEIDGDEVAVLETPSDDHGDIAEVAEFAWWADCGFVVVEPSTTYHGGCTTYLTEQFCVKPRRRAATALAANKC
jgi:hypothetical protein